MESSLFFTDGDLYSGVSRPRDELMTLRYLVEFQEHTERRLGKRADQLCNRLRRAGNPYSEISDLVVDCLLLRDLFSHVNNGQRDNPIPTYLVIGNRLSKLLNESRHLFGIFALI